MLFQKEHVDLIISGRKTQTRRIWKRRMAKPGAIHKCKTARYSKDYFARIEILEVYKERFGNVSEDDAKAEGYLSKHEFTNAFFRINGISWESLEALQAIMDKEVYVVKFRLHKEGN